MSQSSAPGRGAPAAPLRAGPWLLGLPRQAQWGEGAHQTVLLPEAAEIDQMQVTREHLLSGGPGLSPNRGRNLRSSLLWKGDLRIPCSDEDLECF